MDEKDRETFGVEFDDREIMFYQPSEGQLAVIARAVRKAKRGGGGNALEAIGLILDVIDKMVVDADDRNWLEDGLTDATLSLGDFISVLEGIDGVEDEPATPHPVSPVRTRRGNR